MTARVARRAFLVGLAGTVAAAASTALLGACADSDDDQDWPDGDSNEDCDADDLEEKDRDCGYYDDNGVWVLYPWVVAGHGGKPPAGSRPKPPAGVKGAPPRRTAGDTSGGNRSGSGTRSGGGSRGSTGGSRVGGGRR